MNKFSIFMNKIRFFFRGLVRGGTYALTDKGHRTRNYLVKVVDSGYEPITEADFADEEILKRAMDELGLSRVEAACVLLEVMLALK